MMRAVDRCIRQLATEGQVISKPGDALREPYVLECLGLDEKAVYTETANFDHLEHCLLEL